MYTVIEAPGWGGGGSLIFFWGKGQRGCKNIQRGTLGFNEFLLANYPYLPMCIYGCYGYNYKLCLCITWVKRSIGFVWTWKKKNDDLRLGQFSSNFC
jgi:hypothetical protein